MRESDPRQPANGLRRRLLKNPRDFEALVTLAEQLEIAGQLQEAETLLRRAHRVSPTAERPFLSLGRILQLQGRYIDALAIADAALAANPGFGVAWQLRGDSLGNAGRHREAISAYANTLQDEALSFDSLMRMGKMHRLMGETDNALAFIDEALRRQPDSAVAIYQRGLLGLANGDFAHAWGDYAARWRAPGIKDTRGFVPMEMIPLLNTAPTKAHIVGKRVLLIGDQGIGDQVMFASMIPDLQLAAQSVLHVCEPRLMRLFTNAFPKVSFVHPSGAQVDGEKIDVLIASSDLGSAFRTTAADFSGRAYLKAQANGVSRWEARLGERPAGLRIGISWRGGVPQTGKMERSVDLTALRSLLETPACQFISLQYGDVAAEIEAMNATLASPIHHFPSEDLFDFQDFADLIETLDLVISVQNATVHLAGSLGKPCVAMLPKVAEWRYMRQGSSLPWYSSVHLIRQAAVRDWAPVVAEAVEIVRTFCPGGLAGPSVALGRGFIDAMARTRAS